MWCIRWVNTNYIICVQTYYEPSQEYHSLAKKKITIESQSKNPTIIWIMQKTNKNLPILILINLYTQNSPTTKSFSCQRNIENERKKKTRKTLSLNDYLSSFSDPQKQKTSWWTPSNQQWLLHRKNSTFRMISIFHNRLDPCSVISLWPNRF